MTENGDIAYHVYRASKDNKTNITVLVPLERVESHVHLEEGQIICDVIGSCNELLFDP